MLKNILLIFAGIALTIVLAGVGGWVMLQLTPVGRAIRESGAEWYSQGDPFESMRKTMLMIELLVCPVIAIAVGTFIGLLAEKRAGLLATMSISPLVIFFLLASKLSLSAVALSVTYLLLASLVAFGMARWKIQRGSGIAVP
ncbi:MAG TPA: hypothetical protein VK747_07605 [Blastocatellia bacterium]|nr:hypothetical protein [Blastocatellia bacterium]